MTKAGVARYRRENPGSKLKTAVTGKVKKGSKDAKRRKSFCARSAGQMKKFPKAAKDPKQPFKASKKKVEVLMPEKVEVTLARLEERLTQLQDEVRHVHEEVSELKAQANRWKGAFWVMLAMGGVVGSIAHLVLGWIK